MRRRGLTALVVAITAIASIALASPVAGAAGHPILIHGHATILASQIFDLDHGHLSPPGVSDIFYEDADGVHLFLDASGGPKDRVMGTAQPSYSTCSNAALASHRTPMEQLPDGTYLCWKTSGNRIARVRVLSHSTSQVDISYTTWKR